MNKIDVAIIGGGLAGLKVASTLYAKGKEVALFESQNYLGGKLSTDHFKGFTLDRGFQVFFEAYPECQEQLNYPLLELKNFDKALWIRYKGGFHLFSKPELHPIQFLKSLFTRNLSIVVLIFTAC